jgi:hypothetical protein
MSDRWISLSDPDYTMAEISAVQAALGRSQQANGALNGANFLFLGCRFNKQLTRTYARHVMKRSSNRHWAVIEGPLTRMEHRFLHEQNITRNDMPLAQFVEWLQTGNINAVPVAA